MLDLAIIGSGPAALTAALYAARAGLVVNVFERAQFGGALVEISEIANFPGFVGSGSALADQMRSQAAAAGAKINYGECTEIIKTRDHFELTIDRETQSARAVLVATGSEPRQLHFDLPDTPVSYCALCDGDLVKGKNVAVVGGANSALQEAIYLNRIAKKVTIYSRSQIRADQAIQDQVRAAKNIEIHEYVEAGPEILCQFDHVFVFIGKCPATNFIKNLSVLDEDGYVITDANHMTGLPGLFAAGDVRADAVRQAITAAGDGAAAAISITNYLKES